MDDYIPPANGREKLQYSTDTANCGQIDMNEQVNLIQRVAEPKPFARDKQVGYFPWIHGYASRKAVPHECSTPDKAVQQAILVPESKNPTNRAVD